MDKQARIESLLEMTEQSAQKNLDVQTSKLINEMKRMLGRLESADPMDVRSVFRDIILNPHILIDRAHEGLMAIEKIQLVKHLTNGQS